MADKKLYLLDGHALVYRAYFAFINRPLYNSKGLNTSAITGFTKTLWDLLNTEEPTHIAVVFDPDGPVFRHDIYKEYKADREEQPEDITLSFPYIYRLLEAFKIPVISVENYEADDVIGTLAKKAEEKGYTIYMVTSDKDFCQLVSENIIIYKPGRQGGEVEFLDLEMISKKWGVEKPQQVIDMLAMQGDKIDNIPGIPGVGPKTAQKLLKEYGSLENILENADLIKGKLKERVKEHAEQARLSKILATIKVDAPIELEEDKLVREPLDTRKLAKLFKELEFRALAKSILGEEEPVKQGTLFSSGEKKARPIPASSVADKNISHKKTDYQLIDTEEGIVDLAKRLENVKVFALDTETTGLDSLYCELVGISIAWGEKNKEGARIAYYIPIGCEREKGIQLLRPLKKILEKKTITLVGQNLKFDAQVLRYYDIHIQGFIFDTMLAHYLLEPDLRHGLDYLSETYLKYRPIKIEEILGKRGKNQLRMDQLPPEKVRDYAAEDADVTWQLYEIFEPKLKEENLYNLYTEIEEPLLKVLIEMEINGVYIDKDFLRRYSEELKDKICGIEEEIFGMSQCEFNIGSPKQVGEVLFDEMQLPYKGSKTKTGQYKTGEEILTKLAPEYSIVGKILEYRALTKLKSTYVDALPKLINKRTGRLHSSFNQALAATGRLSSANPNLQNIPIKTEEGRKIRRAFIPEGEDEILLSADYSQIELRLIAELSGDSKMLEAFSKKQDIHRATAAGVFDVDYDNVTAEQRRRAKTVNFSIIYGAGSLNLSRQLEISTKEASQLIDQYFKNYSSLKNYIDETVAFGREYGFVKTLAGRKRYLDHINSRNGMLRSTAERIAVNTPIQGTAADMIKKAMISIHEEMQKKNYKSKMILQVHDELVFEVKKDEMKKLELLVREKMRNALPDLKVPIVVDVGTGEHWLEAH